mmetsp:Transcript_115343/g.229918  ORF Transcript_115343/g.229918 Transcript_115343/m.229918 type:complete len:207 (-) Transcript_115343:322-942(-)
MSQEPQVDATAVEGVRAARQSPYLLPRLQLADADGTFRRILSQLNLCFSGDCLAWQGANLRGSKARINRAMQSLVACQATYMPPTGDNIIIFDFTEVRLSTAHTALENPGDSTQGPMKKDPQVAKRQPKARKPELSSRGHALGRIVHHSPKPESSKQRPERKKWQRNAPCEGDQEPGQYAFVPQCQQEVALSCRHPIALGCSSSGS